MSDDANTNTVEDNGEDVDRQMRVMLVEQAAALSARVSYLEMVASANVALGFCAGTLFLSDDKEGQKRAKGLLEARCAEWGDQCNELAALLRDDEPDMSKEYARVAETMLGYAAR